ncbi:hypothetical protein [Mucilaginibacter sp. 3215]|uniref:hypothetical protein n=1 Tax=Mucilaginibacter sp. 3215 TaxID=3373912 RepID=UPI003D201341
MKEQDVKVIYFYGSYFISNPNKDEYLMIDIPNSKVRLLFPECFEMIEEAQNIKNEFEELKKYK